MNNIATYEQHVREQTEAPRQLPMEVKLYIESITPIINRIVAQEMPERTPKGWRLVHDVNWAYPLVFLSRRDDDTMVRSTISPEGQDEIVAKYSMGPTLTPYHVSPIRVDPPTSFLTMKHRERDARAVADRMMDQAIREVERLKKAEHGRELFGL
jgi:hypothetical protein